MQDPIPFDAPDGNGGLWSDIWAWPLQLLVVAAVGWFLYQWLRPRPAFQINIRDRTPHVVCGRVRPAFLSELTEMLPGMNVMHGTISGHQDKQRIVLRFSREFSPAAQQQVRNVWYAG
jgi:hypothetical protein